MNPRNGYTGAMRKVILLALAGLLGLVVLALALPPIRQRLLLVPLYVESTLSQYRPTPVVPTPPAESAHSPQELLQTRPLPSPTLAATNTPAATPTTAPVETAVPPTPTPTATATPIPITPVAPAVALTGFTHDWQTWNNCGPTTISMNLSYYGIAVDQASAAELLKPNSDDKNVSPQELAAYARRHGFSAMVGRGGSVELLQTLISNGFPVIVETWLEPEDRGGLGHYRLFTGYAVGHYFVAQDSLYGPDVQVPVAEFDDLWRVFNRTYVLVYRPEEQERISAILGDMMEEEQMLVLALQTGQAEAQADPADPYAWFNIGSSYAALGEMELAASAFDEARRIGLPFRMLWYQFEIFEAYYQIGRYQDVIDLATATLQGTGGLEELYYYRGLARQAVGDSANAAADFQAALNYNPLYSPAAEALEAGS